MTLVDELRLKILDCVQPDGTVAFSDDELHSLLDSADDNLQLAAAFALEALVLDRKKLVAWSQGLTLFEGGNAKIDYTRLGRDLAGVAERFRNQAGADALEIQADAEMVLIPQAELAGAKRRLSHMREACEAEAALRSRCCAELTEANRLLAACDVLLRDSKEIVERVTAERDKWAEEAGEFETQVFDACAKRNEAVGLLGELVIKHPECFLHDYGTGVVDCRICGCSLEGKEYIHTSNKGKPYVAYEYRCQNPDCPAVRARDLIERRGEVKP